MEESFDLMQDVYTRLEELEVKLEIEDMAGFPRLKTENQTLRLPS